MISKGAGDFNADKMHVGTLEIGAAVDIENYFFYFVKILIQQFTQKYLKIDSKNILKCEINSVKRDRIYC